MSSPGCIRLRAHLTGAGLRYRVERWEPSTLSRRGIWRPSGPLMEPRRALQITEGQRVDVVR